MIRSTYAVYDCSAGQLDKPTYRGTYDDPVDATDVAEEIMHRWYGHRCAFVFVVRFEFGQRSLQSIYRTITPTTHSPSSLQTASFAVGAAAADDHRQWVHDGCVADEACRDLIEITLAID